MIEKSRRAREHNELLSQSEQLIECTNTGQDTEQVNETPGDQPARTGDNGVRSTTTSRTSNAAINEVDQVRLFIKRVKPGLTKKLTPRWHGPFRVKEQIKEFAFELELPDRSGYRFYPVVHISRLKKVTEQWARLTTKLVQSLGEADRLDFDEEILPEDSWLPDSPVAYTR